MMIWRPTVLLALVAVATATSSPPEAADFCQGCRSIVSYARKFNTSSQRPEYKDLIRGFCEHYYPVSTDFQQGPCPVFVDGLFHILDGMDPVNHCDQIGACGPSGQPSDDIYDYLQASEFNQAATLRQDTTLCDACISVVEQVKTSLSNPTVVEVVRQRTEEFCMYLAIVGQEKECKQIIDKYLNTAVTFIRFINSRDYCSSIDVCSDGRMRAAISNNDRRLPTLADFNNFGIETSASVGPRPVAQSKPKASGECMLCKSFIKEMFHFLRENKTEANIMRGLDRVCHMIYPASRTGLEQCQEMVKAYTRELVQLLVDETDPDMICMLLGLCAYEGPTSQSPGRRMTTNAILAPSAEVTDLSPRLGDSLKFLISALEPEIQVDSARSCVECKMFIAYLKDRLENPKSEDEVKEWLLTHLCKGLPEQNLVSACTNMVQAYSSIFFQAIVGRLNPQAACVELGVCNARSLTQVLRLDNFFPVSASPGQQSEKVQVCNSCVDVVSRVDDYMSSHVVEQDARSLVTVCNSLMGSSARRECNTMIRNYGLEIIHMVPTMKSSRQLCTEIALC